MDLNAAVLYRMADAPADQPREADSQNHPGRLRSSRAAGGTVEAIVDEVLRDEVLRRRFVTDEARRQIVREACEDAAAGRRPRW
jgi:hypothetical protein